MTISKNQSKMEKRLRLRDWLELRISDPNYPGLEWVNKKDKIFRIPWKHGGRHGWKEEEDARLFREWSEHTGASPRDVKQHKANFRCALNSLRDVSQIRNLNKQKGDDAYRVYQMKPKKKGGKERNVWIKKRKSPINLSKERIDPASCRSYVSPVTTAPSPSSSSNFFSPFNGGSPLQYESDGTSVCYEWPPATNKSCCGEKEFFLPNKTYPSSASQCFHEHYQNYRNHKPWNDLPSSQISIDNNHDYTAQPYLSQNPMIPPCNFSFTSFPTEISSFNETPSCSVPPTSEARDRVPGQNFAYELVPDSPINQNFHFIENKPAISPNLYYENISSENYFCLPQGSLMHAEERKNFSNMEFPFEKTKQCSMSATRIEEQNNRDFNPIHTRGSFLKQESIERGVTTSPHEYNLPSKDTSLNVITLYNKEPTLEYENFGYNQESPNFCDLSTNSFNAECLQLFHEEHPNCTLPSADTLLTPMQNRISDSDFSSSTLMIPSC